MSRPFAQQVDADQHVELAQAQVADDLHALHRVDVRVQVTHAAAVFAEVFGEVFRHALGQRGDEHAVAHRHAQVDLAEQIVDLRGDGRISTSGSIRPVGRTTSSTTSPADSRNSYGPGVADT
jgi:hypothetical protein